MGCFYHIKAVVDNAVMLAKQFGADEEIVIIAAWLHDIASITDYNLYEEHHIPRRWNGEGNTGNVRLW